MDRSTGGPSDPPRARGPRVTVAEVPRAWRTRHAVERDSGWGIDRAKTGNQSRRADAMTLYLEAESSPGSRE